MTSSTPSATGSLEKSPLLHLLVSGLEQRISGTLVLETAEGHRSALLLECGVPVKIKLAQPVHRLGTVLGGLGWLEESRCEQSFTEASERGILHGEHLTETGTLDRGVVARGLRSQMMRKLVWASKLAPSTVYGLYDGQNFLVRWAGSGTPVSSLRAVWQIGREAPDSAFRTTLMARMGQQLLRIHKDSVLEKFGFDSAERALLDVLRARPQTIAELAKLDVLPVGALHNLLYVLTLTRQLELGNGLRPLGIGVATESIHDLLEERLPAASKALLIGSKAAPSSAPSATPVSANRAREGESSNDPAETDRRRMLLQLAESEAGMDHYQLLSVSRESTAEDIQQAFFRMAKQFHPDRLGPELADLRDTCSRVFARLTQAQQTLSDKSQRANYDAQLTRGGASADDEQQRIQVVIQAATSFQKAEVLFKRRMLAAAELEATRAHEGDPEQADYLALLAWISASKPDSETQLPQILDRLNQAVQMAPENERIRYYRAQVLSRLGRQREALADFRFVVTKNPHHIDAQREIRIWEMRRRGQETEPGGARLGTRTSSSPPRQSNHPSGSRHPARNSMPPAEGQRPPPSVAPKTGMLGKLFKR